MWEGKTNRKRTQVSTTSEFSEERIAFDKDDCMLWDHVYKDDKDGSVSVVRGALKVIRQRWLHEAIVKLTYSCTVTTDDGRCEGKDEQKKAIVSFRSIIDQRIDELW
jgi:hypothetical protein